MLGKGAVYIWVLEDTSRDHLLSAVPPLLAWLEAELDAPGGQPFRC